MSKNSPSPVYIFRHHTAQVNALTFANDDKWFISADSDGKVAIWDLTTRRTLLSWTAHTASILHIKILETQTNLITQGRDGYIHAWNFEICKRADNPEIDDIIMNDSGEMKPIYSIQISHINFCKCSILELPTPKETLIAVPDILTSEAVDIFTLENGKRIHNSIGKISAFKSGLVMAISMYEKEDVTQFQNLYLLIAYESGHISGYSLSYQNQNWMKSFITKLHSQPILSMATVPPYHDSGFSSAADGKVIHFAFQTSSMHNKESDEVMILEQTEKPLNTAIACLDVRDDNKIIVGGGWDGHLRIWKCSQKSISSTKYLKPLAVLKYHKDSVYAVVFASTLKDTRPHYIVSGGKEGRIALWDIY